MQKLPKIKSPIFEITLPVSKKEIKFRPFTVKEEKNLLIAQEEKNISAALDALRRILNDCVFDCDTDALPAADFEYALLALRSRSVDNIAKFGARDPETNSVVPIELNLDNVKLHEEETLDNKIKLDEENTIFMRYPTIIEYQKILESNAAEDSTELTRLNFDIMISCMETLVSGDSVLYFKDFDKEEKEEFVNDLSGEVITKLKRFFETLPRLRHEIKYTNSLGKEKTLVLQGVESFFM